ncbi:MAG: hypothetical protein M2R45_03562 [Verrucomicrobia subdivision 3 bacterium]|nr:hypothetical protein [Limisphaerales bacterium]MCS1416461.1 hypothetical protein [Limisphaerales bacterium]
MGSKGYSLEDLEVFIAFRHLVHSRLKHQIKLYRPKHESSLPFGI